MTLQLEEMHAIHKAVMTVLKETGLKVENADILKELSNLGVDVDMSSGIVRLPAKEIEETIRQFVGGEKFRLGRDGVDHPMRTRYIADKIEPVFGAMHGLIYDFQQKKCRRPTHDDMRNFVKMGNHFGFQPRTAVVSSEVPAPVSGLHSLAVSYKYGDAKIPTPIDPTGVEFDTLKESAWGVKLVSAVTGTKIDKPYFPGYVSSKSPLVLGGRAAEILLQQSRDGYLTIVNGMPITGASSPITLASSLVIQFAESFGFNTLSRFLCRPPNNQWKPRGVSFAAMVMDVRKGNACLTGPEVCVMRGAFRQMLGEFYKMQGRQEIFVPTAAQEPGTGQAAEEKTMYGLYCLLATFGYHDQKPPVRCVLGHLNANFTMSFEQCLLDLELVRQLERIAKGMTVNEETLATRVIKEVGPGGSFLDTDHTLENYPKEFWFPRYGFRGNWDSWLLSGRKSPLELAHEEVERILQTEAKPVLNNERIQTMNKVLEEAEQDLLGYKTGVLP